MLNRGRAGKKSGVATSLHRADREISTALKWKFQIDKSVYTAFSWVTLLEMLILPVAAFSI
jgi:hypothetical protein